MSVFKREKQESTTLSRDKLLSAYLSSCFPSQPSPELSLLSPFQNLIVLLFSYISIHSGKIATEFCRPLLLSHIYTPAGVFINTPAGVYVYITYRALETLWHLVLEIWQNLLFGDSETIHGKGSEGNMGIDVLLYRKQLITPCFPCVISVLMLFSEKR